MDKKIYGTPTSRDIGGRPVVKHDTAKSADTSKATDAQTLVDAEGKPVRAYRGDSQGRIFG